MDVRNYRHELERMLDIDTRHREMLFRRGYLFTSKQQRALSEYPFYDLWSEIQISPYFLYVQEKQTFYIRTNDKISSIIIGHAYNPFDMTWDEESLCEHLIEAYKNGIKAYFEKVSELTGLHIILLIDGEKIIACQDACGLTGCYFGTIDDDIYFTEHPQLVGDICNLQMDAMVAKLVASKCYNIGNRHLPGNITPFKELKRLGANTYVEFDGDFQIKRFYPLAAHAEFKSENEKKESIKRIGELIHNGIACSTKKWKRCAISLSGGTDSKTTLACANGLYDRLSYYSFNSKPQEQVDAIGAGKICKALGLSHSIYDIPQENESFEDFELVKKILQHNTSYFVNLADNEIRKYLYFHDKDMYDIELKSWASEVVRVFFERKYKVNMPKVLSERHCSIFQTRYFGHPGLLRWSDRLYYEFLHEIGLEKPLFNFEHTDLIYWEVRMSCWGVSVVSSQQLYHRTTMPMNNRKILELFLGFPREERIVDRAHKQVMDSQNSAVMKANVEIPNLYFHGYRIMMEKVYYWWRTLFYTPRRH